MELTFISFSDFLTFAFGTYMSKYQLWFAATFELTTIL